MNGYNFALHILVSLVYPHFIFLRKSQDKHLPLQEHRHSERKAIPLKLKAVGFQFLVTAVISNGS